jgi:Asp-tRNA(Asn)/Glu-tRNA(Gln) amidotransferase A subunit family amidase
VNDLLTQPAVDLLALVAANKLSAQELAEQHIRRIEDLNPELNALVDFDPDRVRHQARALDASTGPRGLLHGLPLTIKSSISVADHLCETGSLLYRGRRPAADAETVKRLREAGAIILGTTNCPEFLMAYETDNRVYGRTCNPWNLTLSAGGSSGGEAAAIAAGLSAGGLGSDGGGSVREPAHFTGICALKPTPGRIPSAGHMPSNTGPFALLGTMGPMARTMADVTLLYRVVSGMLDVDPAGVPVAYRPVEQEALRKTPIGYFEDDGLVPVSVETRQAVRDAVTSLRGQGLRVERFRPVSLEAARQLWWKLFVRCGAMLIEPMTGGRESELSPTFLNFLDIAHSQPPLNGDEMLSAWCEIDEVRARLLVEMRRFPILLSPVCSIPAFRHGEREWTVPTEKGGSEPLGYLDAMRFTQWFNLLGSPAASVPVGRSGEGLPIGIQIAGRPYEDELVLGVATALERDFGYIAPHGPHSVSLA